MIGLFWYSSKLATPGNGRKRQLLRWHRRGHRFNPCRAHHLSPLSEVARRVRAGCVRAVPDPLSRCLSTRREDPSACHASQSLRTSRRNFVGRRTWGSATIITLRGGKRAKPGAAAHVDPVVLCAGSTQGCCFSRSCCGRAGLRRKKVALRLLRQNRPLRIRSPAPAARRPRKRNLRHRRATTRAKARQGIRPATC